MRAPFHQKAQSGRLESVGAIEVVQSKHALVLGHAQLESIGSKCMTCQVYYDLPLQFYHT